MGSHGPPASLRACVVIALTLLGAGKSAQTAAASNHSNIPFSNAVSKESDFPKNLGNVLGTKKAPCEAGLPCGKDQWCSPSRHVCRSCEDILRWCHNTELIHTLFPDCEPYCYETLLGQAEECRVHSRILQNRLYEKEGALNALKEEAVRQKAELMTVTLDLRQQQRKKEDMQNTILALAIVTALSVLWALATSFVLWPHFLRSPSRGQRICFHDSATAQGRLLEQDIKCPVEVHSINSGVLYGNC